MVSQDILQVLPKLYDAAIRDEKWDDALDSFVKCTGAASAALFAFEHDFRSFGLAKAGGALRNQQPAGEEYSKKFRTYEDEAMAFFAQSAPLSIFRDVDVWPDLEALRRRGDFQFMRERFNVFRRLGARLNGSPAWFDGCIVHYHADTDEIPAESQRLVAGLLPSLAKAVELNRFFHVLKLKYRAALAALDRVRIGVCVVDPRGYLVVANDEARRIFALNDGVVCGADQTILCAQVSITEAIKAAVRTVSMTAVGENLCNEVLFAVDRRSGGKPFLIEVVPLRDSLREIDRAFAGAMVSIIDPDNARAFSTENVAKLYRLTPAEAVVCRQLVDGLTNEHIADMRRVSIETVKSQTKAIYRKLNVSGRADLIREVLTVNPPIG